MEDGRAYIPDHLRSRGSCNLLAYWLRCACRPAEPCMAVSTVVLALYGTCEQGINYKKTNLRALQRYQLQKCFHLLNDRCPAAGKQYRGQAVLLLASARCQRGFGREGEQLEGEARRGRVSELCCYCGDQQLRVGGKGKEKKKWVGEVRDMEELNWGRWVAVGAFFVWSQAHGREGATSLPVQLGRSDDNAFPDSSSGGIQEVASKLRAGSHGRAQMLMSDQPRLHSRHGKKT